MHRDDVDERSKHRCEISHTAGPASDGALPYREVFWHAFAFRTRDWPAYADEQVVAQWLPLTGTRQNPIMALTLIGGAIELRTRSNRAAGAPKERNEMRVAWREDAFDGNRWHDFVLRARISADPADGPFIELWLDGLPVAADRSPIGYAGDAPMIAKFGYYRYLQTRKGGPWPAGLVLRGMDFSRSIVVRDALQRYDVGAVRAEIAR